MEARTSKGLTLLYGAVLFCTVLIIMLAGRANRIAEANTLYQDLVGLSETIAGTYQTMDVGLRTKASGTVFESLGRNQAARLMAIEGPRGETLCLWLSQDAKASPAGGIPRYDVPTTSFSTVVYETSLPGAARLRFVYDVVPFQDAALYAYMLVGGLIVWILVLVLVTWAGSRKAVQTASVESDADQPPPLESTPEAPRQQAPQPEPTTTIDPSDHEESPAAYPSEHERDPRFVLLDRATGVSQERFFKFRLDKELERNAENAMDMSLAEFRFKGLASDDYGTAAALLLSDFNHEDLIYEHGSDSFCVILPQHDLDQAIARCELLLKKVDSRKDELFKGDFELTVGLSSRNGRLLDANRFHREAMVALKKASRHEGRIVGFRPDPVKFRNYLRHHRV